MTRDDTDFRPETWALSDGKQGMVNQCLGLAEALGVTPSLRQLSIRQPWRSLPPQLWLAPLKSLAADSAPLTPPWPDLLIATGRQTVAPAMAIRRRSVLDISPAAAPRARDQ